MSLEVKNIVAISLRFVVVEEIGTGGYATVYRGINRNPSADPKEVAIKKVNRTPKFDERAFEKEVSALKRVSSPGHPFVIRFYEAVTTQQAFFIVTELAKGKEMFELVKGKPRI